MTSTQPPAVGRTAEPGAVRRTRRSAPWLRAAPPAVLILLGLAVPYVVPSAYTMRLLDLSLIYAIYALSLNVVLGYTGLINLGQSAFLGLGAYSTGAIAVSTGWPFWVCLLASVLFGAVAGVIVGVPSLRVGGHYLAVVTLGFTQIAYVAFVNLRGITGGYDGLTGIPAPRVGGAALENAFTFYYLPSAVLLVVAGVMALVRRRHIGRAMLSVREDLRAVFANKIWLVALT
jgi:branched-chain amino acid transport system permease protein